MNTPIDHEAWDINVSVYLRKVDNSAGQLNFNASQTIRLSGFDALAEIMAEMQEFKNRMAEKYGPEAVE